MFKMDLQSRQKVVWRKIAGLQNPWFFLLYRQKDIDKVIEGNDRNYVIDKLTSEIMENKPLGSRM